jgi:hypothetical protein
MYGTTVPSLSLSEVAVEQSTKPNRKFSMMQVVVASACSLALLALVTIPQLRTSNPVINLYEITPETENLFTTDGAPASDSPGSYRKPSKFIKYSTSIFEHPKVQAAFQGIKQTARENVYNTCLGPENNIDVFINEEAVQHDLMFNDGYTVFNLDCRDKLANPLIAFIVVLDMQGNVVNIHNPTVRAEAVSMFSSDTVLFSCISKGGAWLWNWKTDEVTGLPWVLDAHTLQFVASEEAFYGLDRGTKFSPSTAVAYNLQGEKFWSYENDGSHINFLTVSGDYAYISLRSYSCLIKLDKRTNEIVYQIGGDNSDFTFYDKQGNLLPDQTWDHQHKFQFLDDQFVSLFDNHVNLEKAFIDNKNSRMVVLKVNEQSKFAQEVFAFDTGDKSRIYGGADILPSGNVLGNSYPMVVEPAIEDRQYHANIWEVNPSGEIVSRIAFKGFNPSEPSDVTTPYFHSVAPTEEPPIGWMIYNVERFYSAPTFPKPCVFQVEGQSYMQVLPFNSIRSQGNAPGMLYLVDTELSSVASKQPFEFHGSWLPKPVSIAVPETLADKEVTLIVSNQWGDNRVVNLGKITTVTQCENVKVSRYFHI